MKAVIGRFYKKYEDATAHAIEMMKAWNGRVQFYVISAPNGNLVVSGDQMEACGYKKPARYTKANYKGKLSVSSPK